MLRLDQFGGQPVCAIKTLSLIQAIAASIEEPDQEGSLTLPPMQRNSVWRPTQVLEFWRSALDGMPLGLFYLQPRARGSMAVDPGNPTTLREIQAEGFDLIDGQQRVRALALGAGSSFGDRRQIWVRFKEDGYELVLSSNHQPFGYKDDGTKHGLAERRKARDRIERDPKNDPLRFIDPDLGSRDRVFDSDLFSNAVRTSERIYRNPPLPIALTQENSAKLSDIVGEFQNGRLEPDSAAWARAGQAARERLLGDLGELRKKRCFLALLEAESNPSSRRSVLKFFVRVGAGGTPLTGPEQWYAAFKMGFPKGRNAVETIAVEVVASLSPAQIVASAIRIARVQARKNDDDDQSVRMPELGSALDVLSGTNAGVESWGLKLHALFAGEASKAPLVRAFKQTRRSLLEEVPDEFRVPAIVLAQIGVELWQVLGFWLLENPEPDEEARAELARFAWFWQVAVHNRERAVRACLGGPRISQGRFPAKDLVRRLIAVDAADDPITPAAMRCFFISESGRWPNWATRFANGKASSWLAGEFWHDEKRLLFWAQRKYLHTAFPGFDPLGLHEDDKPYDIDHICAQDLWRNLSLGHGVSEDTDPKTYLHARNMVGDSVGNKRIVDSSQNRSDGANSIKKKMPFVFDPRDQTLGSTKDFFVGEERSDWQMVGEGEIKWNRTTADALKYAAEQRLSLMYDDFYATVIMGGGRLSPLI